MFFKRKRRWSSIAFVLVASISIIYLISLIFSSIQSYASNYYRHTIYGNITVRRSVQQMRINIHILSIVNHRADLDEYQQAINSIRCYTSFHNYAFTLIILDEANETFAELCPQKDFLFRRHCIVAEHLHLADWTLFIDSDVGMINPNHLIEEYIDATVALIFYNRIFNFEIAAGSYLANNSAYGRYFLRFWANYETRLPDSFHGADNGALQIVFVQLLVPDRIFDRHQCELIWHRSRDYSDLYIYEACIRLIVGAFNVTNVWPNRVALLRKRHSWVRDGWLTMSMWSWDDFMLHGWQRKHMNSAQFASWSNPIAAGAFNQSICNEANNNSAWRWKDTFMRSRDDIANRLLVWTKRVDQDYRDALIQVDRIIRRQQASIDAFL